LNTLNIQNLESQSLWYKYKTKVWLEKSEQMAVVHNIMRVLRAIRNSGYIAYVSVPITTSRFLYELKLDQPQTDKAAQLRIAIEHNYAVGWDFVEEIRKKIHYPIIYPADLTPIHQEWEQNHFQALWLSIIAEKCTELHMGEGWEYSNGGVEEFTHVWQLKLGLPKHPSLVFFNTKENEDSERERMRNLQVYDHKGNSLTINDGTMAIEKSLAWLKNKNFETERLKNCLSLLHRTDTLLKTGFYQ